MDELLQKNWTKTEQKLNKNQGFLDTAHKNRYNTLVNKDELLSGCVTDGYKRGCKRKDLRYQR